MLVLELMDLELQHQEAPDLQKEQTSTGTTCAPCLTQLLEASFTDLHGGNENLPTALHDSPTTNQICDIDNVDLPVFQQALMKDGKAALSLVSE